ncbi:hypothetical protein ACRYCC_00890 [Actinomadura scrupuli]|uniref:hypothetical protein n=1 Tax=Actinomadura scrupuli TaxID=559629 RepID=UPI003D99AF23
MTKPPAGLRLVESAQADLDFLRPVPHNIEAEQRVLGSAMLAPSALAEVRELRTAASSTGPRTP